MNRHACHMAGTKLHAITDFCDDDNPRQAHVHRGARVQQVGKVNLHTMYRHVSHADRSNSECERVDLRQYRRLIRGETDFFTAIALSDFQRRRWRFGKRCRGALMLKVRLIPSAAQRSPECCFRITPPSR